jgi:hypothetical protein
VVVNSLVSWNRSKFNPDVVELGVRRPLLGHGLPLHVCWLGIDAAMAAFYRLVFTVVGVLLPAFTRNEGMETNSLVQISKGEGWSQTSESR